jgi:pyruvate,orthophosphate dikinase
MTSHAAVVARGMGKCCVAGCEAIEVDYRKKLFTVNGGTVKEGDWISLDGTTGEVMAGRVPTRDPVLSREYHQLMTWVDTIRRLKVRTNADTPDDAKVARAFGAEGIGLCRTEHMFFEGDRITLMREMILASDEAGRRAALKKLLPVQRRDFEGIFRAMDGLPVTIRLLDPPLHEFLPHEDEAVAAVAEELKVKPAEVRRRAEALKEFNPMLGHRGCRLGITYPEISEMQARAIIEAACNMAKKGVKVLPEIMIPLIGTEQEFTVLRDLIVRVADEVMARRKVKVRYLVGTMMEIPRACLVADRIAAEAEFFSFGTNDLTQMAYGYSRDDSGRFLEEYIANGILTGDPFQSLDIEGVGQLVEMGTRLGRRSRPKLKVGVCGEHGGDPASVIFFHHVGLDYVSCSPYRVPIARLAAAHAVLGESEKDK